MPFRAPRPRPSATTRAGSPSSTGRWCSAARSQRRAGEVAGRSWPRGEILAESSSRCPASRSICGSADVFRSPCASRQAGRDAGSLLPRCTESGTTSSTGTSRRGPVCGEAPRGQAEGRTAPGNRHCTPDGGPRCASATRPANGAPACRRRRMRLASSRPHWPRCRRRRLVLLRHEGPPDRPRAGHGAPIGEATPAAASSTSWSTARGLPPQALEAVQPEILFHVAYRIPRALTDGKETVTVRFQGHPGKTAGGIFDCRTMADR